MHAYTLNRWDIAKLIGLALMFVDHTGAYFYHDQEWLRGIGRGTAVIFLFLTGFAAHYRFSRELLLLAILLTISDWLVKGMPNTLNILWTILACRMLLQWLEAKQQKISRLHEWVIGCVLLFPSIVITQYGALAILLSFSGFLYKHKEWYTPKQQRNFLLLTLVIYAIEHALLSEFQTLTNICMVLTLAAVFVLLNWVTKAPATTQTTPLPLRPVAQYSGYIYALHLIALGWLTGKSL